MVSIPSTSVILLQSKLAMLSVDMRIDINKSRHVVASVRVDPGMLNHELRRAIFESPAEEVPVRVVLRPTFVTLVVGLPVRVGDELVGVLALAEEGGQGRSSRYLGTDLSGDFHTAQEETAREGTFDGIEGWILGGCSSGVAAELCKVGFRRDPGLVLSEQGMSRIG